LLARDFDAVHVSTGDLLRRRAAVVDGSLAPDSLVLSLLKHELSSEKQFILDGFPRSLNQARQLDDMMPDFLEAVLFINVPESVLLERIQGKQIQRILLNFVDRWIHVPSGRTYSYSYCPPRQAGLDDETGEPLVQRCDDTLASFKQRMQAYHQHIHQISDYFRRKGKLYSFTGPNSHSIYQNILQAAQLPLPKRASQ
jgi:adenylate kinase